MVGTHGGSGSRGKIFPVPVNKHSCAISVLKAYLDWSGHVFEAACCRMSFSNA